MISNLFARRQGGRVLPQAFSCKPVMVYSYGTLTVQLGGERSHKSVAAYCGRSGTHGSTGRCPFICSSLTRFRGKESARGESFRGFAARRFFAVQEAYFKYSSAVRTRTSAAMGMASSSTLKRG